MPSSEITRLYGRWLDLWNGDLAAADEIVAADCVVHQAPFGAGEPQVFRGSEGLVQMVTMGRQPFDDFVIEAEVGPIAEGHLVAARWTGRGRYRGGLPGASAEPGTPVTYGGMDLFRLEHGKIAEYWVSADVYALMAQLGAVGG